MHINKKPPLYMGWIRQVHAGPWKGAKFPEEGTKKPQGRITSSLQQLKQINTILQDPENPNRWCGYL